MSVAEHWFEPIAEHLGPAYLRYSFTKGTDQEVDFLVGALGLRPGERVLDVGCGPGRHAHALARRGMVVHGVDIAARFVELAVEGAPPGATFERLDARRLPFDGEFDVAVCLCQGAFGLMRATGEDEAVLGGIGRALRPGGRLALSAFNAYFVVKHHTHATFDADTGVAHERTEVRNPAGAAADVDLWTGCYTPRELRLLMDAHGFTGVRVTSVEPGAYGTDPPSTESPSSSSWRGAGAIRAHPVPPREEARIQRSVSAMRPDRGRDYDRNIGLPRMWLTRGRYWSTS